MGAPRLASCHCIAGVLTLALGFAFHFLIVPVVLRREARRLGDANLVIPNDTSSPRYKAFEGSAGQPPRYWKFYVRPLWPSCGLTCRGVALRTRACGGSPPQQGFWGRFLSDSPPRGDRASYTTSPTRMQ